MNNPAEIYENSINIIIKKSIFFVSLFSIINSKKNLLTYKRLGIKKELKNIY